VPFHSGPARLARRLGARIRALRVQGRFTQEKVAWDCELSKAHLSQIEAGRGFPSVPTLFALAKRLGVEAVDLVCLDPTDSRTQILEAVRIGDIEALRQILHTIGIWEQLAAPGGTAWTGREGTRKRKKR
jgi:transcriptional regulator with XRE-family HTH domain